MGGIDLDPCTSIEFNRTVQASKIHTAETNGLHCPWFGSRVFINPPGGLVKEFWQKLVAEIEAGNVEQAVWIGFSVEQLCLLADETLHPMDFSVCIVRKRISFIREDGYKGSPSHGNYIVGLGVDHTRFEELFSPLGKVTRGVMAI